MKKVIIGAAVFVAAVAAARRFGPAIAQHGMKKCHQMMSKCQETFSQQAGASGHTPCMSATTSGPEQPAAAEHEPAEASQAS